MATDPNYPRNWAGHKYREKKQPALRATHSADQGRGERTLYGPWDDQNGLMQALIGFPRISAASTSTDLFGTAAYYFSRGGFRDPAVAAALAVLNNALAVAETAQEALDAALASLADFENALRIAESAEAAAILQFGAASQQAQQADARVQILEAELEAEEVAIVGRQSALSAANQAVEAAGFNYAAAENALARRNDLGQLPWPYSTYKNVFAVTDDIEGDVPQGSMDAQSPAVPIYSEAVHRVQCDRLPYLVVGDTDLVAQQTAAQTATATQTVPFTNPGFPAEWTLGRYVSFKTDPRGHYISPPAGNGPLKWTFTHGVAASQQTALPYQTCEIQITQHQLPMGSVNWSAIQSALQCTNKFPFGQLAPAGYASFFQLAGYLTYLSPNVRQYVGPDGTLWCDVTHRMQYDPYSSNASYWWNPPAAFQNNAVFGRKPGTLSNPRGVNGQAQEPGWFVLSYDGNTMLDIYGNILWTSPVSGNIEIKAATDSNSYQVYGAQLLKPPFDFRLCFMATGTISATGS